MMNTLDAALIPPAINFSPGEKYDDNTRLFQGIPGIERAPNGRLWAAWYAGGPDEPDEGPGNYVTLVTSDDDGRSWSRPTLVIDPPGLVRAYDPCLWHDSLGRLWLFWMQSYHHFDGRAGVWAVVTENSGEAHPRWYPPRRLCDGIALNKPTVTENGDWLLPAAIWDQKPPHNEYYRDLGAAKGANVMRSRDQGATWMFSGQAIVPDRTFDEHLLIERRDKSLWMLARNAHGIAESISRDGGLTWSAGVQSSIPHIDSRFFICRLHSGKLLLVTHNPPDKVTRSHLTAHLSDDDGQTWDGGLMIDEREQISYPDAVQAPDGTIYLVYDFERYAARQILIAIFTEEDVACGAWDSRVARQKVVVNQATGQR
jgi:hypothetical protein